MFGLNFCLSANEWQELEPLTALNTNKDEFAARHLPDGKGIIFNSNNSNFSKFYISNYEGNIYSVPQLIKGDLNKERNNQSYLSFANEAEGYFSTFKKIKKKSVMRVYSFRLANGQYLKGKELELFSDNRFVSHTTISQSGKSMVIAAENITTHKTELYQSFRDNSGNWSEPNLITELSSEENEITPYLQSEDTLYFATNGFGGKGGYDIFVSTKQDGLWQRPSPLLELNTEYDESDFAQITANRAIYSSNKPGGKGGLDLYLAKFGTVKQNHTNIIALATSKLDQENIKLNLRRERIKLAYNFYSDYNVKASTDQFYEIENIRNMGDYLLENKNEKLTLIIRTLNKLELDSAKNSKFLADTKANFIKEFLVNSMNIDEERIAFKYNYTDNPKEQTIFMKVNKPLNIFTYVNSDTLDINPSKVSLTLNNIDLADYQFSAIIGNEKKFLRFEKTESGAMLDLLQIQSKLADLDSIKISIINTITSSEKQFNLDLLTSKKVSDATIVANDKRYEIYPIYFKTWEDCQEIELIKKIEALANGRELIIASFQSDENHSYVLAEKLYAESRKTIKNIQFDNSNIPIPMRAHSVIYLLIAR